MTYCDHDQEPTRTRIGTVLRTTFPARPDNGGEHRARTTLPMTLEEAIRFHDPFQAKANREDRDHGNEP